MPRFLFIMVALVLAGCADRVVPPPAEPRVSVPNVPTPDLAVPNIPPQDRTVPDVPPQDFAALKIPPQNPAVPDQATAATCDAQPEAGFQTRIPAGALDTALLDRAILFHSNRARCEMGLRPLGPDPRLLAAATGHSADMVRLGFFDHTSPVPGKTTMSERLQASGVAFLTAAENLATAKRLEIGDGQPVYPLGQGRCAYSYTPRGQRVPVRTYDSLALNLVTRWLESPGHRRNLLNNEYTRHGASGVIDPSGHLCDSISATQLFAG